MHVSHEHDLPKLLGNKRIVYHIDNSKELRNAMFWGDRYLHEEEAEIHVRISDINFVHVYPAGDRRFILVQHADPKRGSILNDIVAALFFEAGRDGSPTVGVMRLGRSQLPKNGVYTPEEIDALLMPEHARMLQTHIAAVPKRFGPYFMTPIAERWEQVTCYAHVVTRQMEWFVTKKPETVDRMPLFTRNTPNRMATMYKLEGAYVQCVSLEVDGRPLFRVKEGDGLCVVSGHLMSSGGQYVRVPGVSIIERSLHLEVV